MKKTLLYIIIGLLVSQNIFSQEKIYLDKNWKKTTQEHAQFYRILTKENDLYRVNDFYINGLLQMEGHFSNLDKEIFEGEIIWYDNEGRKTTLKHYKKGNLVGENINYLKDGSILSRGYYKDGKPYNGIIKDLCACPVSFALYKDGKIEKELTYYENSTKLAKETMLIFVDDEKQTSKTIFYDKKGDDIGTLHYKIDNEFGTSLSVPNYGTEYEFYRNNYQVSSIKIKRTYKDSQIIKETIYKKNGEILMQGEYKDNEPWSGEFYNFYKKRLSQYKDGVIQIEIVTNKQLGDKDGDVIIAYKDGQPYNGQLIKYTKLQTYKDGTLITEDDYYSSDFKHLKSKTLFTNIIKIDWFDKKGSKLGTGSISDDLKNGFFIDDNDYINYVNNKKEGLAIEHNYKSEIISKTFYKNDIILWKKTYNPQSNDFFHCDYKNNTAYNGVLRQYQTDVYYYKDGLITKIDYYKSNELKNLKKRVFYENSYHKVKQITYKDNKAYSLTYKNEQPYNGIEINEYGYITYQNGQKNGAYEIVHYQSNIQQSNVQQFIEEGTYQNNLKEGLVTFRGNDVSTCEYIKGKPYNGTIQTDKEYSIYKNGQKEGVCTQYFDSVTITTHYKKGLKNGEEETFLLNNDKTIKGVYKQDKYYTGNFYKIDKGIRMMGDEEGYIVTYYKGKKHGLFFKEDKYTSLVLDYKKGKLVSQKSIYKQKDSLLSIGYYKKGLPYSGKFLKKDNDNYNFTKYNKGKIINEETLAIDQNSIKTIEMYSYKNGIKDGKYYLKKSIKLPHNLPSIQGVYKKGIPFDGQFITSNNQNLKIVSTFKQGVKDGVELYETSYSHQEKLFYKKGKITHGVLLELMKGSRGGYFFTHHYQNSRLEKTETFYNDIITYDKDGFTIKSQDHLSAVVKFTDSEKNKGTITYYISNKNRGFLKFENGHLISGNIDYKQDKQNKFKTTVKIERNIKKSIASIV